MNSAFNDICKKYGFTTEDQARLKELVNLNNGHITPGLLRSHFGIGWAACSRLVDDLATGGQAQLATKDEELQLLPPHKRQGGGLEPSDASE